MLQHREGEKESNNRSSHLSCLSARLSLLQSRRREDPLSLVNHNESSLLSRELKRDIFIFLRKCIQIS